MPAGFCLPAPPGIDDRAKDRVRPEQEKATMADALRDRRRFLAMVAALPVLAPLRAARAWPESSALATPVPMQPANPGLPFPDAATLIVAGPEGGLLDRWAQVVRPALIQPLPPDTRLRLHTAGGADGVTGANQFDARTAPDGLTLLMVPGEAWLASLTGDPRAKFDVGHWMPVMAAMTNDVLAGRPDALASGSRVRIPVSSAAGDELPALLALELLGLHAQPVPALPESALPAAFANHAIDVAFLHGHNVPDQVSALATAGIRPLFAFGAVDDTGALVRPAAFPDVPLLSQLAPAASASPLYPAWQSAAAAAQLEFGIMLPQLTPAGMVALWRRAGTEAAASPSVQALGRSLGVALLSGTGATAVNTAMAAPQPNILELRRWLAGRFNWRPV
jgi:hypothetical protein